MPTLSVLDLSPICEGSDAAQALHNSRSLAQHCEKAGYHRYWVAEHHNMKGIASAATSVLISHIAEGTASIRWAPGHHVAKPLAVDGCGTIRHVRSALPRPYRLGSRPCPGHRWRDGTCAASYIKQRSKPVSSRCRGAKRLSEQHLPPTATGHCRPRLWLSGPACIFWVLACLVLSWQHFGPALCLCLPLCAGRHDASHKPFIGRKFEPSEQLEKPHVILGYNICAAQTEEEAALLRDLSGLMAFLNLRQGKPGPLPKPDPDFDKNLTSTDQAMLQQVSPASAVGTADTVRAQVRVFAAHPSRRTYRGFSDPRP